MYEAVKFKVMLHGNTMESHSTFLEMLTISTTLRETNNMMESDFVVAFVPVVSRAGTDLSDAIDRIPKDKPAVIVVLHHTFNDSFIVPDLTRYVNRPDVFTVHCLFHEDQGLLRCLQNDEAIKAAKSHMSERASLTVARKSYRYLYFTLGLLVCIFVGVVTGVGAGTTAGVVTGVCVVSLYSVSVFFYIRLNKQGPNRHTPSVCLP